MDVKWAGGSIPTPHRKGGLAKVGKPAIMGKTSRLILEVRHMEISIVL